MGKKKLTNYKKQIQKEHFDIDFMVDSDYISIFVRQVQARKQYPEPKIPWNRPCAGYIKESCRNV